MPIRPNPYTLSCPHCPWFQVQVPRSDALPPVPTVCPRCGHGELKMQSISPLLGGLVQQVSKVFSRRR